MTDPDRAHIASPARRRTARRSLVAALVVLLSAGCTATVHGSVVTGSSAPRSSAGGTAASSSGPSPAPPSRPAGTFTVAFAGDVHFSGRIRPRLNRDPATVFAQSVRQLRGADLTMVNLETAITDGGIAQPKEYHFRAPASSLTALRDAGIDVATEANNHGADYGEPGLRDTLRAIHRSHFPVIGIGADTDAAFAPYRTTLNGVKLAIFAADDVDDETTLRLFSAGAHSAGVANAHDPRLETAVRRSVRQGYVTVVYVHWGIEYDTCPSSDQFDLAAKLAKAGASAVIGTHAHVLQGAGWKPNGTYVAYGLGNYLWWRSYHNNQDDNGVLTLTFRRSHVVGAHFIAAHLDGRGVPLRATGAQRRRIDAEFAHDRGCAHLAARPPS